MDSLRLEFKQDNVNFVNHPKTFICRKYWYCQGGSSSSNNCIRQLQGVLLSKFNRHFRYLLRMRCTHTRRQHISDNSILRFGYTFLTQQLHFCDVGVNPATVEKFIKQRMLVKQINETICISEIINPIHCEHCFDRIVRLQTYPSTCRKSQKE